MSQCQPKSWELWLKCNLEVPFWLKLLVSPSKKSALRDLHHILKRAKLRPKGTSNLSKVTEEDGRGAGSSPSCVNSQTRASTTSPSLCPAESVCLPPGQSPSPWWKIRIQCKQSSVYFKAVLCRLWDVGMAAEPPEMSECVMGFVLPRCGDKPWDKQQCSQGRLEEAGGTSAGADYHFWISCRLGGNLAHTCWEEWMVRIGRN